MAFMRADCKCPFACDAPLRPHNSHIYRVAKNISVAYRPIGRQKTRCAYAIASPRN